MNEHFVQLIPKNEQGPQIDMLFHDKKLLLCMAIFFCLISHLRTKAILMQNLALFLMNQNPYWPKRWIEGLNLKPTSNLRFEHILAQFGAPRLLRG